MDNTVKVVVIVIIVIIILFLLFNSRQTCVKQTELFTADDVQAQVSGEWQNLLDKIKNQPKTEGNNWYDKLSNWGKTTWSDAEKKVDQLDGKTDQNGQQNVVATICDSIIANNANSSSRPVQLCKRLLPDRYPTKTVVTDTPTVVGTVDKVEGIDQPTPSGETIETFAPFFPTPKPRVAVYGGDQQKKCYDNVNACVQACNNSPQCQGYAATSNDHCCLVTNLGGQLAQKVIASGVPVYARGEGNVYSKVN